MTTPQDPRTLNPMIPVRDDRMMRTTLTRIATALDQAMATIRFEQPTSEVGNKRTIPMTVVDRHDRVWEGPRWLVMFWLGSSQYGPPVAATSVSATVGTIIEELTANASYLGLSDANGRISLEVEVTGAATLYPHAMVIGSIEAGEAVSWT